MEPKEELFTRLYFEFEDTTSRIEEIRGEIEDQPGEIPTDEQMEELQTLVDKSEAIKNAMEFLNLEVDELSELQPFAQLEVQDTAECNKNTLKEIQESRRRAQSFDRDPER